MELIKEMGCLPCLLIMHGGVIRKPRQATVQHVVEGYRRLGHDHTYGSCDWHHLGVPLEGYTMQQMHGLYGPSLANGKKCFQQWFGWERDLVDIQSFLIDEYKKNPWPGILPYREPHLKAVELWIERKKKRGIGWSAGGSK